MTNLTEAITYDNVVQLETTTQALGGADGPMNAQAQALLNRTAYLKNILDNLVIDSLESTSPTSALSANQGNALDSRLTTIETAQDGYGDIVSHNVSEFDVAGSATSAASAAQSAAQSYAEGLLVGLWDDRGSFSAASGNYPTSADGGSGVDGDILKGDIWTISAAGTLPTGRVVEIGDVIRALVDDATNTANDWAITQNNIGYVTENSTNKSTDNTLGAATPSDIKYPSEKAVKNYVDGQGFLSATNTRYVINPQVGTTYIVLAADVTSTGRGIVKCTNTSAIAVTLPAPSALSAQIGDSVNIRQGGTGVVTVSGTLEGNGVFSSQYETKTFIALNASTWLVVGG